MPVAFGRLVGRNRRRYGGYVVHASIVLLAIGVAGSSAYDSVAEGRLVRGESLAVGDYTLTYRALTEREGAERDGDPRGARRPPRRATSSARVPPGKNAYSVEQQVSNEVGIRSDLLTGEDLFVIAEQVRDDGAVVLPRLREAARQPHLARGLRVPARLADHPLAGRARGAPARDAIRAARESDRTRPATT